MQSAAYPELEASVEIAQSVSRCNAVDTLASLGTSISNTDGMWYRLKYINYIVCGVDEPTY